jgi:hypothetical protein
MVDRHDIHAVDAAALHRLRSDTANLSDAADIDTFVPRFRKEALAVNAVITMPLMITAWAHVPDKHA